jgi:hypothetical protein
LREWRTRPGFQGGAVPGRSAPKSCPSWPPWLGQANGSENQTYQPRPTGGGEGGCLSRNPISFFEKILRNRPQRSMARGVGAAKQTLDDKERPGRWSKRQTGQRFQWALLLARAWGSAPSARGFACGTFTVPQPPASAVVPPYAATEPQIPRQNAPSTRPVANPTGSSVSPSA